MKKEKSFHRSFLASQILREKWDENDLMIVVLSVF